MEARRIRPALALRPGLPAHASHGAWTASQPHLEALKRLAPRTASPAGMPVPRRPLAAGEARLAGCRLAALRHDTFDELRVP